MRAPTPKVDVKSYYLANFSQRLHEIEKKLDPEVGVCVSGTPLRSANAERDAQTTVPASREMIVMEERN